MPQDNRTTTTNSSKQRTGGWGSDDELLTDEQVFGGWGAGDELLGDAEVFGADARRDLPTGVKPNETAGAGRGGIVERPGERQAFEVQQRARKGTTRGVLAYAAGAPIDRQVLRFEPSQAGAGRGSIVEQPGERAAFTSGSQPYSDRRAAVDDAVDRIALGAPADKVFEQFASLGISRDEIVARGVELDDPHFTADTRPVTVRDGAQGGSMVGVEPNTAVGISNFGKRVAARGSQALTGAAATAGIIGPDATARLLARDERKAQAAVVGTELQRELEALGQVKEWGQVPGALADNMRGTAVLLAESLALSAPALVTTVMGLPRVVMATGVGVSSGSLEYGSALSDALGDRGVSLLDVDKVAGALRDPKFIADVRERGAKRGLTIGLIDAFTAGMAGKFVEPALAAARAGKVAGGAAVRQVAAGLAKEIGVQMAGGAGGEALGQKLVGDNKPLDIALEALAEGVSAPMEARSNLAELRQVQRTAPQQGVLASAADSTMTPLRAEDMKTTPVTPDEVVALTHASQQQRAAQEAARQAAAPAAADAAGTGTGQIDAQRADGGPVAPTHSLSAQQRQALGLPPGEDQRRVTGQTNQAGADRQLRPADEAAAGNERRAPTPAPGQIARGSIADEARRTLEARQAATDAATNPVDESSAARVAEQTANPQPASSKAEPPASSNATTAPAVTPGSSADTQDGMTAPEQRQQAADTSFPSRDVALVAAVQAGQWRRQEPAQGADGRWRLQDRQQAAADAPASTPPPAASNGAEAVAKQSPTATAEPAAPTTAPPPAAQDGAQASAAATSAQQKPASQNPAIVAAAAHSDPGKAPEPATAAVAAGSVAKAAAATDRKPAELRADLARQIDAAAAQAEPDPDDAMRVRLFGTSSPSTAALAWLKGDRKVSDEKLRAEWAAYKRGTDFEAVLERVGYANFDVDGDGQFTVLRTPERLAEFKRLVERSAGFKATGRPGTAPEPDGAQRGSPSTKAAIEAMLDDNDPQASVDYAAAKGTDIAEIGLSPSRLAKVAGLVPTEMQNDAGASLVDSQADRIAAADTGAAPAATADATAAADLVPDTAAAPARAAPADDAGDMAVRPAEMTQAEFLASVTFERAGNAANPWVARWKGTTLESDASGFDHPDLGKTVVAGARLFPTRKAAVAAAKSAHRRAVKRALQRGEAVPEGVRAEYPDLAPPAQASETSAEAAATATPDTLGIDRARLVGRTVSYPVTIAETGQVATVEIDAAELMGDLDAQEVSAKGDTLSREDSALFVERMAEYTASGIEPATARKRAIADLLAELQRNRAEAEELIRAQHPDLFLAGSASEPKRIEDFGEVIPGARKEAARAWADKLALAETLTATEEPLAKSWPKPDYQRLLDGGVDPYLVAFAHAARDSVPQKPSAVWKLKGWAANVTALRDLSKMALTGQATPERVRDALAAMPSAHRDIAGVADLYRELGHGASLKGITLQRHEYSFRDGKHHSPPLLMWTVEKAAMATAMSNWPNELATGATKAEAIAAFKPRHQLMLAGAESAAPKVPTRFDIVAYRGKPGVTIGKKVAREFIALKTFATPADARQFRQENQAELDRLLAEAKAVPHERRDENLPRIGVDHRDAGDVTPAQFAEVFGFRGVQFGNYVEGTRRQRDLNDAFDALMDLAGVLGLPPRSLSLGGTIGLAFGARGHGGKNAPSAHFETARVAINLTKGGGAGSLAHEWFHAADNAFARQRGEPLGFLTQRPYARGAGVRPEMVAAFKRLMDTIKRTGLAARSSELDKTRSKPYWSTDLEMAARSFEHYVIAKLQDQGAANDYLANIVSENAYGKPGAYPYPTADESTAIRAAFDEFFAAVQTREDEAGNVALFQRKSTRSRAEFDRETAIQALPEADRNDPLFRPERADLGDLGTATALWDSLQAFGKDRLGVSDGLNIDDIGNIVVRRTLTKAQRAALIGFADDNDLGIYLLSSGAQPTTDNTRALIAEGFSPLMTFGYPGVPMRARSSTSIPLNRATFAYKPHGISEFMFSRGDAAGSAPEPVADPDRLRLVRAAVKQVTAGWANSPDIEVLASMQDAPEPVRRANVRQLAAGAQGQPAAFYFGGKVYVLASQMNTQRDVAEAVAHEALGHFGLRGTFGAELGTVLNELAVMREADVRAKAAEYGLDFGSAAQRQQAAEEVLADLAHTEPELSLVRRAIAAIRTWLRQNIPLLADLELTDAEVVARFILPARSFVVSGAATNQRKAFEVGRVKRAIDKVGSFSGDTGDIRFQRRVDPAQQPARDFALRPFGRVGRGIEVMQDRYNRWKQAIDDVRRQGGSITEANDFYRAEERYWGQVGAGIEDFKDELTTFVKAVNADGLTVDDVALYAYALHAEERNELVAGRRPDMPDGGSGMTTDEADEILQAARDAGVEAELQRHAATLRQWIQGTREVLLQGGLIDQDQHDTWTQMFQNYVPLRGVEDTDAAGEGRVAPGRQRRRGGIRGDEAEHAEGRQARALKIVEQIAADRARALVRVGRNEVLRSFARFVLENPSPGLWEVNAVERRRTATVDEDGYRTMQETEEVIKDGRTITLKDDGQEVHILVKDAKLLEQLQRLGLDEHPAWAVGALLSANRFLSRVYTSLSPVFTAINALRDAQAAAIGIIDEIGFMGAPKLFAALPRAWVDSFKAEAGKPSADYALFKALGGRTSFHNLVTVDQQAEELQAIVADADRMAIDPRKFLPKAMALIEALNGGIENATRLAAFNVARQSGMSAVQAASVVKNITVNFNRRGTQQLANAWVLFFNPAVQGTARLAQAMANPKVQAAVGTAMLGVAALALRNAGMGDDDDGVAWWDKIPDEVKERNLVIVLPPGSTAGEAVPKSKTGRYIKVPMPYGYNFFAVMANQMVDVWRHSQDAKRGRDLVRGGAKAFSAFASSWLPAADLGRAVSADDADSAGKSAVLLMVPDALDPLARVGINQDSFGRPMRPDSRFSSSLPDSAGYFSGQHGTMFQRGAAALNDATGGSRFRQGMVDVAPATMEHLARSYGGGPVSFGLDLVNSLYVRQSIARPELDSKRLPFAKQFYGVIDAETDRMTGYQRLEKAEKIVDPIKRAMNAGDAEEAVAMRDEAGQLAGLGDAVLLTRQNLSEIVKHERTVIDSTTMSDSGKYVKLLELAERRRAVLQRFNAGYDKAVDATVKQKEGR